ncbi:hypothetical protein CMV_014214 [Castanea mollissima]|uniref:NAD(+) ADP-ribosyltransferase n=1 Tax=Castanea mollissima TaxID=60419 RepID=A0A8J4VL73_9ROSI|nr:hypothetical protein CMV_014214 [Castanea mollissima]
MAIQQLKVEELQTQLGQRGLSTTGTKPTLVQPSLFDDSKQLCAKKTSNQLVQKNGLSANKKRDRDSENGDSIGSQQKIKAVEKFREIGIQQLRQQAALRGISATGSMKEIIERLSKDSNHDLQDCPQADEEESESNEEKIVTATKKGAVVLDQWLPDDIKAHYHVLHLDDEIYDAMLNQTNVGDNNNKLYMIQALESNDGSAFMVYNSAIQEFEQKFLPRPRTSDPLEKKFICLPKSYTWLEMDYGEQEKESDVKEKLNSALGIQPRETQLGACVEKFLSYLQCQHDEAANDGN